MSNLPIILVSCTSKKRATRSQAQDLYDTSKRFVAARTYARREGSRWFILSAKHGLLEPTTNIEPYNQALSKEKAAAKKAWSGKVATMLGNAEISAGSRVVILAGSAYRHHLTPILRSMELVVEEPLARMRMGEQHQWLNQQNGERGSATK